MRFASRETVCQFSSDHAFDDSFFRDIVDGFVESLDCGTVADNRDLVGYIIDFIQLVRNHNRCNAFFLKVLKQVKELSRITFVKRGGGLVENKKLDVLAQSFRNFNKLLLADADILNQGS